MILYFTGTGNSRYVAKLIGTHIHSDTVSITDFIKEGRTGTFTADSPYVFVAPAYGWRIPRLAEKFIRASSFKGNKKAYFVMTCGTETGNASHYLKKLCEKKGFDYMGLASILMPENYIAMFDAPQDAEAKEIILRAQAPIISATECIKNGNALPDEKVTFKGHIQSTLINPLFYSLFVKDKGFYTTDACISCGKCVKLCPTNNIRLQSGKPVWTGNCTHCMACICGCPRESIEYKNKSQGKPRYFLME